MLHQSALNSGLGVDKIIQEIHKFKGEVILPTMIN